MLRHLTVPYVSYWSFGEQLPVLEERSPSADQISFALETVAAVIAQQFDRTDLLADNRDAYVAAARSRARGTTSTCWCRAPGTLLADRDRADQRAACARRATTISRCPATRIPRPDAEPAKHLCLVVDGEVSRWQATEAERFLRHTLDADGDRQLFCVLTRDTDRERLPAFPAQPSAPGVRPEHAAVDVARICTTSSPNARGRGATRPGSAAERGRRRCATCRTSWPYAGRLGAHRADGARDGRGARRRRPGAAPGPDGRPGAAERGPRRTATGSRSGGAAHRGRAHCSTGSIDESTCSPSERAA